MIKKLFLISIVFCFLFSKEVEVQKNDKISFSIGAFNERLAYNLVNFSYALYSNNNHEIFFSVGHASILLWTAGFGWKRYFPLNKNKKVTPFLTLSIYERTGTRLAVVNGSSIRV